MDLLQLRYFQAVARAEHVSRAADQLRVAQPSLSRNLARLEAELGVPLFDRRGRRVRLNRYGAAFLHRVDRALGELDDARRKLTDAAGLEHGSVAVAAENLRALTDLLAHFLTERPGVNVRLYQSSAPGMLTQLHNGDVDLCLASQPLNATGLHTVELRREEVLLVVPPHHHLAGRDRVDVAALAGESFVTTRVGHWQRTVLDQLFAQTGREPAIVCEGDEPAALRGLVSAGLGVGLLPAIARTAPPHPPVGWLHLHNVDCHRVLRLVWRGDAYLSLAARRFRDLAIEHLGNTANDT